MIAKEILQKHYNVNEAFTGFEIECITAAMEEYAGTYKALSEQQAADIRAAVAGVKTVCGELGIDLTKPFQLNPMTVMGMIGKITKVAPTLSEKLSPLFPLIEKYGTE